MPQFGRGSRGASRTSGLRKGRCRFTRDARRHFARPGMKISGAKRMAKLQLPEEDAMKRSGATGLSKLLLGCLLAGAGLINAGPAMAQAALTPLPVVVISVSVTIWPAIVADKKGFFKEEGLDFDLINSGASTRSLQQVAAGSAPIGSSSMVDTLRA